MFCDADEYVCHVRNKRETCMKSIGRKFGGERHLYMLDEAYARQLRQMFDNLPICLCLLTRLCESMPLRTMFENGMRTRAADTTDGDITMEIPAPPGCIVDAFRLKYEGPLGTFIRDAIKSIWIYGFLAMTYLEAEDDVPAVVDVEECVVFSRRRRSHVRVARDARQTAADGRERRARRRRSGT